MQANQNHRHFTPTAELSWRERNLHFDRFKTNLAINRMSSNGDSSLGDAMLLFRSGIHNTVDAICLAHSSYQYDYELEQAAKKLLKAADTLATLGFPKTSEFASMLGVVLGNIKIENSKLSNKNKSETEKQKELSFIYAYIAPVYASPLRFIRQGMALATEAENSKKEHPSIPQLEAVSDKYMEAADKFRKAGAIFKAKRILPGEEAMNELTAEALAQDKIFRKNSNLPPRKAFQDSK